MADELSCSSGTSSVPLLGETIDANLRRAVERFGDREALVDVPAGRRLTYAQVDAAVDELARGLLARGIEGGDRVGIWAPNCADWFLVQFATARIGAILVNINPAYRTHELEYVLNQAGVSVLVAARSFKTSDYAGMIEEVRPRCASVRRVVLIGSPEWDALVAAGRTGDRAELAAVQATLTAD